MASDYASRRAQETRARLQATSYPQDSVEKYCSLVERIERDILPHEVIVNNQYTHWFEKGEFERKDLCHFLTQFSVFSNFFIVAQLLKTINAPTLEAMHASKEILMNELGVSFHNPERKSSDRNASGQHKAEPSEFEGTVDGSTFYFAAAHFEWLLHTTTHLGLQFKDVGKRKHGSKSTLFFCDELARIYASEDASTATGASFAVENWAAAGFWKELIGGLRIFKARECPGLPLGFFTWHDMVEDQHAKHTWEELEGEFFSHSDIDTEKFIQGGVEMLNGVLTFWRGLDSDRVRQDEIRKLAS